MTNSSDLLTLDSALAGHTPNVQTLVDVDNRVVTGNGADFLDLASANFTLPAGLTIFGGTGSPTMGSTGNETIWTNSNATTVTAGTANTTVLGGAGNDIINGGTGNDTIDGEGGANTIASGAGDDTIYGNPGDTINGGVGNDTLILKLTATQAQNDAADLAAAQAFIAANSNSSSSSGPTYTFTSADLAGLTFSNIESLQVPNAPEPACLSLLGLAALGLLRRRD
jgi:Ca2+-binding RTX toxin-like protein